jgi:Transcriptional regulators
LSNEKLKPGDKLPPERQLAETLGVSRPALRQALSILEAQNIIDCRQGDGNYVLPLSQNLFNPVVMGFYMNQGKGENILEFRYILEVNIIRLVTLKISEEQILELDQIVGRMENFQTLEIRKELNNTFHFFAD